MNFTDFTEKYNIQLNEQQLRAVRAVDGPVLLLAVPGSGKTTVLVSRLGYMIYWPGDPAGIHSDRNLYCGGHRGYAQKIC